jgi:tRNA A-37 threonylcarbamoyl transferase component Bud32
MATESNYRIKKTIGSGGMSTVYLAEDTRLDRDVAVKVLRIDPRIGLEERGRKEIILRFQQEAKAAARLNHPNIVSIYHVGQQGEQYYIIMEYLDGSSLSHLMKSRERFVGDTVLQWMDQVCDGLHFAHEHGVIHRDIKPDNLILLKNGIVKITDFGIARLEKSELVKTKDQTFMGTIYYCSPEQLREFRNIDRRTDIFSLGVVLYQLLTGELPFRGESIAETINAIISRDPMAPRRIVREIPAALERTILKCLAKNPAERFQTAEELRNALRRPSAGDEERERPRNEKAEVHDRRAPMTVFLRLSVTVCLILMLAAFLFGYFMIESRRNILQKDAAIRGRHIASMFSLLVNDAAIGQNEDLLERYIEEIGQDAHLAFIEMMRGNQVVAGYHSDQVIPEEDVLMMSYPLSVDTGRSETLKVGFSKMRMNRQVVRIKKTIGFVFAALAGFLAIAVVLTRFRSRKRRALNKSPVPG